MAANLDRAETSLTAVSDIAYIRGIDGSGNSVRISKADLASVLGANLSLHVGFFGEGSILSLQYSFIVAIDPSNTVCSIYLLSGSALTKVGGLEGGLEYSGTWGAIRVTKRCKILTFSTIYDVSPAN